MATSAETGHHEQLMNATSQSISAITVAARGKHIANSYIAETLEIYQAPYVTLERAEWDGSLLCGHFKPSEYPFTKPSHISYVTAAMAALYLSQMGYLYTRLTIEETPWLLPCSLSVGDFFAARDRGDLVITKLALKCRQKILIDSEMSILLWRTSVHRIHDHILCKFGFDFQSGSFSGETIMAMPVHAA